ncbi:hypothetical protein ABC733_06570 [Mangrovibacter sp. SLW1]
MTLIKNDLKHMILVIKKLYAEYVFFRLVMLFFIVLLCILIIFHNHISSVTNWLSAISDMVMAFAAIAAYFEAKNFLNKKIASTAYDKASDLIIFKYKEVMDLLTKAHTELSFYLFAIQNNASDDIFNRIEKDKFVDVEVITPMIRTICDIKSHLDKLGWLYNDEALRLHHSLVLNMSSLQLLQISCYGSILSVLECIKKMNLQTSVESCF